MKPNDCKATHDEEVQALLKRVRWLSPQELAERRAMQRWSKRPTVVLIQDTERAQEVLLCRLEEERNPEVIDRVWQANFAYHSRLVSLRSRV